MHPRIQQLLEHLNTQREVLRSSVERFPVDSLRQRPARGGWSAAEVLEHVAIVESHVTSMFSSVVAEGRRQGLPADTDTTTVLDPLLMEVFLNRNRRVETGSSNRPTGAMDVAEAWAELEEARRVFLEAIRDADGLALGQLSRSHPVGQQLNMYDWIAFVGWHEARHAAQIDEIARIIRTEIAAGVARHEPRKNSA
jgi:hypothetical protein